MTDCGGGRRRTRKKKSKIALHFFLSFTLHCKYCWPSDYCQLLSIFLANICGHTFKAALYTEGSQSIGKIWGNRARNTQKNGEPVFNWENFTCSAASLILMFSLFALWSETFIQQRQKGLQRDAQVQVFMKWEQVVPGGSAYPSDRFTIHLSRHFPRCMAFRIHSLEHANVAQALFLMCFTLTLHFSASSEPCTFFSLLVLASLTICSCHFLLCFHALRFSPSSLKQPFLHVISPKQWKS